MCTQIILLHKPIGLYILFAICKYMHVIFKYFTAMFWQVYQLSGLVIICIPFGLGQIRLNHHHYHIFVGGGGLFHTIPRLTYFPFLQSRTWTVVHVATCQFSVPGIYWRFTQNHARFNTFCPSSEQRNPQEEIVCFRQIKKIRPLRKRRSVA